MDKKKQIAELAKELEACCNNTRCDGEPTCAKCRARWIVEQGYRKIPEGAVVLTKEEYGAWSAWTAHRKEWTQDELETRIAYAKDTARKEVARELATRIKEKIDEISSCGLVEEYVTVINKHINDIMNEYVKEVENG